MIWCFVVGLRCFDIFHVGCLFLCLVLFWVCYCCAVLISFICVPPVAVCGVGFLCSCVCGLPALVRVFLVLVLVVSLFCLGVCYFFCLFFCCVCFFFGGGSLFCFVPVLEKVLLLFVCDVLLMLFVCAIVVLF